MGRLSKTRLANVYSISFVCSTILAASGVRSGTGACCKDSNTTPETTNKAANSTAIKRRLRCIKLPYTVSLSTQYTVAVWALLLFYKALSMASFRKGIQTA